MAKKCVVSVVIRLLREFFGFGTLGLDARQRLTLETFSSSANGLNCIDSIWRRKV
jgi:hypothetical protein